MRKYQIQIHSALLAAVLALPAAAQTTISVPLVSATRFVGLGTGGALPNVVTGTYLVTGEAVSNFQPGSYIEWKVACQTPGMYRISILLSQWQDDGSVLSVETRPWSSPENPYATRFCAADTRNYGQTNGEWVFMETSDLEDAQGNVITVPLWAGDNVLRVQNVTNRHNPAYEYPANMFDPRNRDWGQYWNDLHIGRITLNRDGDFPEMGTLSGVVRADRPYGQGVKKALVLANPPSYSPLEPSWFWKNGWHTYTQDDGSYTMTVPVGTMEVKAGRPSGFQVQGSPVVIVDVPASGSATAQPQLTNLFQDDGAGNQVALLHAAYLDGWNGRLGLLNVDGVNGYKVGWVEANDSVSMLVDAPRAGYYKVRSYYTNGGSDGTTRVSNDAGGSVQGAQPHLTWEDLQYSDFTGTLYLRQGPNTITQTLVSGGSDFVGVRLTAPPVVFTDASRALQIAAGLILPTPADAWMASVSSSDPGHIGVDTAVRLLQAVNGRPL